VTDPVAPGVARFRLLASAIAGRGMTVDACAPGQTPGTDGRVIRVDADAPPERQRDQVILHAALVAGGGLRADLMQRLSRRPRAAERFLAVEGRRALAVETDVPRARRLADDGPSTPPSADAATSVSIALSRRAVDRPPQWWGGLDPRRVLEGPAQDDGQQADAAGRRLQPVAELDEQPPPSDGPPGPDRDSPLSAAMAKLLQRFKGGLAAGVGSGGASTDVVAPGTRVGGDRMVGLSTGAADLPPAAAPVAPGLAVYPEWHARAGRYRPNWCAVTELDVEPASSALADTGSGELRRRLAGVGTGRRRARRQLDGEHLDIDAVVESEIDRRAGYAATDRVYVGHGRRRSELAVMVLLDVSGSASDPSPRGGTIHDQQASTAAELMHALHDVGARVAAFGFRSRGRLAVELLRIKSFDEPDDSRVGRRLAALEPSGFTRLGAAVRHATRTLARDGGAAHRVLVVVSDGFAYDDGYEGAHGEADASRALQEARDGGIGCLCLGIGAAPDLDALRPVFGTAAFARADHLDELHASIGGLFRGALVNADVRNQLAQRRRTRPSAHMPRAAAMRSMGITS
jgi:hypothetical protein